MTISIIPSLQENNNIDQHHTFHPRNCTLHWRRGQLLVKYPQNVHQPYLPSLEDPQLLIECLKHSPINLVTIDPILGDTTLKFWLNACQQANKPIYISPSARNNRSQTSHKFVKFIQSIIDPILALILLILVSPLMLILTVMILSAGSASLFSQEWQIGENGKIFPLFSFCTYRKDQQRTFIGFLMSKYHLVNLPQLFNVLRGEMSLLGCKNLRLEDVIKYSLTKDIRQVDELKKVINSWQIEAKVS
ncbi:MAG: sugar transferase [Nostocales cyanobacterium]|nr:MAG: sugar transferase [Nostocales cyanobacterium]